MFDAIHGVNSGTVRGLGKQFQAGIVTILSYYALGLPLALVLGFRLNMGVRGFWLGFTVALIVKECLVSIVILRSSWAPDQKTEPTAVEKMKMALSATSPDDNDFKASKWEDTEYEAKTMQTEESHKTHNAN